MSAQCSHHGSSLYEEAYREAERHKWIESQKQGRDLGDFAIRDWYGNYWMLYCRHRRNEHISGEARWQEFESEKFGIRCNLVLTEGLLADRILDRIDAGLENLDIIQWAHEWGMPIDRVLHTLELIDVNRARVELPQTL
ncbi:hypothetical protein [Calycomorphotria hydatis]|uniref:Uncharacterized protein n=1 Tax=Calycomorphotria hydatis TaxID=2528027 RepID=A0A517TDI4_9PLAN|nr:hypothetical protein [Calycomorphotria hydatis]QDT66433.1 hypothetical protein V22_37000 [Calycomorphotria hydatis]